MLLFAVLAVILQICVGDVYMHNPRGSNNRLNEANAQRANNNRLMDTQNNNRGGYNVGVRTDQSPTADTYQFDSPDDVYNKDNAGNRQYQMAYFEESELVVEWTNQHACGGNEENDPQKVNCNLVIQVACDNDKYADPAMKVQLRNGGTTGSPTNPNTYAEAKADAGDANTGRHESKAYYYECKRRSRNKGLLTLDQKLNGHQAKYTRQNPNGNRNGLECPEERDYYPYWSPTPWIDVAYLTDRTDIMCGADGIVTEGSQNTNPTYKCIQGTTDASRDQNTFINEEECTGAGFIWTEYGPKNQVISSNIASPACEQSPWSRTNHLGNGRDGQMVNYKWTLPKYEATNLNSYGTNYPSNKCVLRLRYNISTDDYDPWNSNSSNNYDNDYPEQNPTVDVGTSSRQGLQLAINTNQFGRTFQDRSHVFYVTKRPAGWASPKNIINLNVRGKRGNIVQTYPSVEYDFVPNILEVTKSDYIHLQWTGSNTHNNGGNGGDGQAGDDGQGTGGTDRNNFVSIKAPDLNYPIPLDKAEMDEYNFVKNADCFLLNGGAQTWEQCAIDLATTGYGSIKADAGLTGMSDQLNNAPASLIGGRILKAKTSGDYFYMSSRNNNFSNRGQKGRIKVA